MKQLEQITLEFQIDVSSKLLYTLISTPEGLARWFADSVSVQQDLYCFKWEGSEQTARLVQTKTNSFVRFQWLDHSQREVFLEMQILQQPTTRGSFLKITDYAESGELEFSRRLWETQVGQLQRLFNS